MVFPVGSFNGFDIPKTSKENGLVSTGGGTRPYLSAETQEVQKQEMAALLRKKGQSLAGGCEG